MTEVITVPESRRVEALRHLLEGHSTTAIRRLEASGRIHADCLWAIERPSGMYQSVALALPNAGRTATIVASRPRNRDEIALAARVIKAAKTACQSRPIDLLQSLLSPTDALSLEAFQTASFDFLADLHTLRVQIGAKPKHTQLPDGLCLAAASDDVLVDIMNKTYEDTLDCAPLRGKRRTQDILDGHRSGGRVHPELVQILTRNGAPIGCVIVTCGPQSVADLAYIGLIPSARGEGLGEVVLRHIMVRAAHRGARSMRLAVDDVNEPARALYGRLGFLPESTQRAVIHSLRRLQADLPNPGMSTTH